MVAPGCQAIPAGAEVLANQDTYESGVSHHLFLQTHLQFQIQHWNPLWDQMDINRYNEKTKHVNFLEFWSASILKTKQNKI